MQVDAQSREDLAQYRDEQSSDESYEEERPKMKIFQTVKSIKDAEKDQSGPQDETLHSRFVTWKDLTGYSLKKIASMISRSEAAVSQYVNQKFEGDLAAIEKDIATLLRREEELDFRSAPAPGEFCATVAAQLTWEVLHFCDKTCQMGAVTGPAGIGKTETCKAYKRENHKSIFVTSGITNRSISSMLRLIAKRMGGPASTYRSNSELSYAIIERLHNSHRLIIIDEAHFLPWETFEEIRTIHDEAQVGIVFVGMQRLYDQMKGDNGKAFAADEISQYKICKQVCFAG